MKNYIEHLRLLTFAIGLSFAVSTFGQPNDFGGPGGGPPDFSGGFGPGDFPQGGPGGFGPGGPGGRGGRGGPGGPGGMMQQEIKLVKQYDKDGNGWLNQEERKAARSSATQQQSAGGMRGRGGRGGFGPPGQNQNQTPPQPGAKLTPADVKSYPDVPFYDSNTVRTLFLDFENADWEKELSDFHNTDVEIPVKLTVDGKTYDKVGVRFRGMSSYMMVSEGYKRSLNLSLDMVHEKQNLLGYRTLNLLNSHEDPTYLRSILFYQIAREYVPVPKANFVRVVINGESWGIYVNIQQFNKDFLQEWFNTTSGARWKVRGNPGARGGLEYLGENVADYKQHYDIKTKDDAKSWADFIKLCKVLNETPADKLEETLSPLLNIDGALKFLALDNALINNDGYWIRSSDYNIYQDVKGRFHILPQDANETFSMPGGPGFGGGRGGRGGPGGPGGPGGFGGPGGPGGRGPRGGGGGGASINGVELDPLVAAQDASKPLLSKLLAVPSLRTRYLGYIREIAEKQLDWNKLGPVAQKYQSLIAADMKADTRKLDSFEDFTSRVTNEATPTEGFGGPPQTSLKSFVEQRRAYLLKYTAEKK